MNNQTDERCHTLNDEQALLDKQQVARALSISIRTIDNLVKSGDFPPGVRMGRFPTGRNEPSQLGAEINLQARSAGALVRKRKRGAEGRETTHQIPLTPRYGSA